MPAAFFAFRYLVNLRSQDARPRPWAAHRAGPRFRSAARARGPASARSRPGAGGRMSIISAWQASMIAFRLWLLLAVICWATTNELNHKDHDAHRGRTKTFVGTFDPLPIIKVHDKLLIAAGSTRWHGVCV